MTDIILDEAPAPMEVEEHPSVHDCQCLLSLLLSLCVSPGGKDHWSYTWSSGVMLGSELTRR